MSSGQGIDDSRRRRSSIHGASEKMENQNQHEPPPTADAPESNISSQMNIDVETVEKVLGPPNPEDLESKNWSIRKKSYELLTRNFCGEDIGEHNGDIFSDYAPLLTKAVNDSHAGCLDASYELVTAYAEYTPSSVSAIAETIAPIIISKGFSARGGTPAKAEQALLKLMEVDKPHAVVNALIGGLKDKKPKVPPACVQCITKAADSFGAAELPMKEIRSILKNILEHKDTAVRSAAIGLIVELIHWCGVQIFKEIIDELRTAQQAEIHAAVKDISPGSKRPSVYLRNKRPKPALSKNNESGNDNVAPMDIVSFDVKDMIEAVDLIPRLKKTEFYAKFAEAKWNEKVEAMKIALDMIGDIPKIVPGDYGDLVKELKSLTGHSHVQVCCSAFKLLGKLSLGLGEEFSAYSKSILKLALEKLSDKKCNKAVCETLDDLYESSLKLDQAAELTITALESKKVNTALAKVSILGWVEVCCKKMKQSVEVERYVQLTESAVGLLTDSDPSIRAAAHNTVVALIAASRKTSKVAGSSVWSLVARLETSNQRAYKKIVDVCGPNTEFESEERTEKESSRLQKPTRVRDSSLPRSKSVDKESDSPVMNSGAEPNQSRTKEQIIPRSKVERNTNATLPAAKVSSKPVANSALPKKKPSNTDDNDEVPSQQLNLEEALSILTKSGVQNIESILNGLKSSKWQEKKDALELLTTSLSSFDSATASKCFPAVVILIQLHTKNFKDANFNVVKFAIEAVSTAAAAANESGVDRTYLSNVIAAVLDKIADKKQNPSVTQLLTCSIEALGAEYVMRKVQKNIALIKAPPAHADCLLWMKQAFSEFGSGAMPVQSLCSFAEIELENGNPKVRTAAIELLGEMYHQVGPPLRSLLSSDIKPASRSLIESTFSKVGFDAEAASKATRFVKGTSTDGAASSTNGIARADLASLLSKDCLKLLASTEGKDSWKGRKASMEEIIAACEKSGRYIEATKFVADLLKELKPRLNDSQSNLKPLASTVVATVLCSCNPDSVPKLLRIVNNQFVGGIGDIKKVMSEASLSNLDKVIMDGNGSTIGPRLEALLPSVASCLSNSSGRGDLLSWTARHLPSLKNCRDTCSCLVTPLLSCLQDKSATNRALSEECLITLASNGCISSGQLKHACRDFPPAVQISIKGSISKILESSPADQEDNGSSVFQSETLSIHGDDIGSVKSDNSSTFSRNYKKAAPSSTRSNQLSVGTNRSNISYRIPNSRLPPKSSTNMNKFSDAGSDHTNSIVSSEMDVMKKTNGKAKRSEADKKSHWCCYDDTHDKDALTEILKTQWSPSLNTSSMLKLFPRKTGNMECGSDGIIMLEHILVSANEAFMDNLDLIFKWITLRLSEKENVQTLFKLLQFITHILQSLKSQETMLSDYEAEILIPTILEKCGHGKERFRAIYTSILTMLSSVVTPEAYVSLLISTISSSKNSRSRIACLEELGRLIGHADRNIMNRKGLRELLKLVDSKEQAMVNGSLDCILSLYIKSGSDMGKLLKLLGPVSDRVKLGIEERIRTKTKFRHPTIQTSSDDSVFGRSIGSTGPQSARSGLRPPTKVNALFANGDGRSLSASNPPSARANSEKGMKFNSNEFVDLNIDFGLQLLADNKLVQFTRGMKSIDSSMSGPFNFKVDILEEQILSPLHNRKQSTDIFFENESGSVTDMDVDVDLDQPQSDFALLGDGAVDLDLINVMSSIDRLNGASHPFHENDQSYNEAKITLMQLSGITSGYSIGHLKESLYIHILLQKLLDASEAAFLYGAYQDGCPGLDVNLYSCCYRSIQALLKDYPNIFLNSYCVDSELQQRLFRLCASHISDKKFLDRNSENIPEDRKQALLHLHKGVNRVMQTAVDTSDVGLSISSVVYLLSSIQRNHQLEMHGVRQLAKVYTKLLERLLVNEREKETPFQKATLELIIPAIDFFFIKNPPPGHGSAFETVSQLWEYTLQHHSRQSVEHSMRLVKVSRDSFLVKDMLAKTGVSPNVDVGPEFSPEGQDPTLPGIFQQQCLFLKKIWDNRNDRTSLEIMIQESKLFQQSHAAAAVPLEKLLSYVHPRFSEFVRSQFCSQSNKTVKDRTVNNESQPSYMETVDEVKQWAAKPPNATTSTVSKVPIRGSIPVPTSIRSTSSGGSSSRKSAPIINPSDTNLQLNNMRMRLTANETETSQAAVENASSISAADDKRSSDSINGLRQRMELLRREQMRERSGFK